MNSGDSRFNERSAVVASYALSPSVRFGRVPPYRICRGYTIWRNPSFKILTAALISRSWCSPQAGHVHSLTERSFVPGHCLPHLEQSCEEGKNRSIKTICFPYQLDLYSSWRRNSLHDASEIAFASLWFFTIFFGDRSSMQMTSY